MTRDEFLRICADRRELARLAKRVDDMLQRCDVPPDIRDSDELVELLAAINWTCPVHPGADVAADFSDDAEGCLLCAAKLAKLTAAPAEPESAPPAAQAVAPSEDDDYGAWLAVRNR